LELPQKTTVPSIPNRLAIDSSDFGPAYNVPSGNIPSPCPGSKPMSIQPKSDRPNSSEAQATGRTCESLPETPAEATAQGTCLDQMVEELLTGKNQSPRRVAQILEQDIGLRGEVIREANAFIYSLGRPVVSLNQAVACLGFNRCRAIIAAKYRAGELREPSKPTSGKPSSPASDSESLVRGLRSHREQRLSSLYPPKNQRTTTQFNSSLFERS